MIKAILVDAGVLAQKEIPLRSWAEKPIGLQDTPRLQLTVTDEDLELLKTEIYNLPPHTNKILFCTGETAYALFFYLYARTQ